MILWTLPRLSLPLRANNFPWCQEQLWRGCSTLVWPGALSSPARAWLDLGWGRPAARWSQGSHIVCWKRQVWMLLFPGPWGHWRLSHRIWPRPFLGPELWAKCSISGTIKRKKSLYCPPHLGEHVMRLYPWSGKGALCWVLSISDLALSSLQAVELRTGMVNCQFILCLIFSALLLFGH